MTGDGPVLPEWLAQRASVLPDRLALTVPGGPSWTFVELDAAVAAAEQALRAQGVSGGRAGLLLGNQPAFVLLVHAANRLAVELVPLNLRLTQAELGYQVGAAGIRYLVHDEQRRDVAAKLQAEHPEIRLIDAGSLTAPAATPAGRHQPPEIELARPHTIVFTSGTTGRPKGAVLTYGNHWWNAIGSALNVGLRPDDRLLACLPLFHVGGLSMLFRGVIYGAAVILHDGFDAAAVNAAIDNEGASHLSVVAVTLQRLLDNRGSRPFPATLRCVLAGGGPIPRELLEECARRGLPVLQTYGLTETASQAVTLSPDDALRKLGSAGKPLPQMSLEIRVRGQRAKAGEVGEIFLRGPSVAAGYLGEPQFSDGWLATGDLGYVDEEGYLYVSDRRDDLIISGGENVYPAEVEAALLAHPAVEEAGVVGVSDARWGQVPVASVKLRPGSTGLTEGELLAYCRERLAGYKVPASVRFVSELPRTSSGKIMRRLLRTSPEGAGADGC